MATTLPTVTVTGRRTGVTSQAKGVRVYAPDVQVFLYKTIGRKTTNGKDATSTRFQGTVAQQKIDLRPYLGEAGIVRVTKSLAGPAGGFSIALADKAFESSGNFESLYGLIEPMDMVEIRARHDPPSTPGVVPVVMRGFVTDVQRTEAMGSDGRPTRMVQVNGQDYGKIWQIILINYLAAYLVGQQYITGFALFEQFGVGAQTTLAPGEFVKQVLDKIINPYLDAMLPKNSPLPRKVTADVTVKGGTVSPGIQTHQGPIYELLRYYGDVGPWNELFMEDREDGVYCVYRPNPYFDATTGEPIQADAPKPTYVDIPAVDIMAINVSRSDANVANFYWVQSTRFNLISETFRRQEAAASADPTVVLKDYPNSDVKLYGNRVMQIETQQGGDDMPTHNTGAPKDQVQQIEKSAAGWMDGRRRIVVDSNKDNVLFESGMLRLRGNEKIRAGCYLRVTRGTATAEYYVVQVDHEFQPFGSFVTNVQVERGTGFVDRIQRGGSPYLAELS